MSSLENAQKRNDMYRARKLPPEIVKSDWDKAMARMHMSTKNYLEKISMRLKMTIPYRH